MSTSPINNALPNTNLGMLKLIYAHHYYRKQETLRFLRNPSNYLTTTKTVKTHQNHTHLDLS